MTSKKSAVRKNRNKRVHTQVPGKTAQPAEKGETPASPETQAADAERCQRLARRKMLLSIVLLTIILFSALWLRMDDLISWRRNPQRAFFNEQPILINFDGYYYLSLARDLLQDTYDPVDSLRGVPQSPPRPLPPPLISVVAALLASITSLSLDWIATLLPPLLGLTLAIPLFLLCRLYAGRTMALTAVAMALFPTYFAYRSNLGWFDTDCLNVTFLLLVCYFFIRFGIVQGRRRYLSLAAGAVTYLLFMLWWDQTPAVVTLICLSPLVIVVLLYYRPTGRERLLAIAIGAVVLVAVMAWQGPRIVMAPFEKAVGQLNYISKKQGSDFPNVGVSVHEQRQLDLSNVIQKTTANSLSFVIGLAGLAGLFWQHKRKAAALMVPFAIGCLSFVFARRFLIFLNPFLAIGFGFAAHWLWQLRRRWSPLRFVVPVFIFVMLFIPFKNSLGRVTWHPGTAGLRIPPQVNRIVYWPKEIPPIVEGLDALNQQTPKDALVWAWWDHGYPLLYWGQRATINDGSLHGGMRTVINGIPLAADSPELSANFMRFYAVQGTRGMVRLFDTLKSTARGMDLIKAVLSGRAADADDLLTTAGLQPLSEWRSFFFPEIDRDIYLFLDFRLARTAYWWNWFGTWDVAQRDGVHPQFKFMPNSRHKDNMVYGGDIRMDMDKGQATLRNGTLRFESSWVHDGNKWHQITYPHKGGMTFVYLPQYHTAAVMDQTFAGSLFSELYFFKKPDPRYFSLVTERYPFYQIWKVHPDPPSAAPAKAVE